MFVPQVKSGGVSNNQNVRIKTTEFEKFLQLLILKKIRTIKKPNMKFQFEKLGYFDKTTEIELGDLTIICGKNNTGKTYISYAIDGFLEYWNTHLDFQLEPQQIETLLNYGVLQLDLQYYSKRIENVVKEFSQRYSQSFLPDIFSASDEDFSETIFRAFVTSDYQVNYHRKLQTSLGTKKRPVLEAITEKDSHILTVTSLAEQKNFLPPASSVQQFINKVIGQLLLI
jgi:hypothetical protein